MDSLKFYSEVAVYLLAFLKLVDWIVGAVKPWWRVRKPAPKELLEQRIKLREEIERNLRSFKRYVDKPETEAHRATRMKSSI